MMKSVSLAAVASYLPDAVIHNDFFQSPEEEVPANKKKKAGPMFLAPTTRRHVRRDETAAEMIERASKKLADDLNLDGARDIDLLLTNVTVPDQAFTGCGAEVARRIGATPKWTIDMHNTGCVAFVTMMDLARIMMQSTNAKTALICNVQNAGGRIFSQSDVRKMAQAPIPGDGCGVGYLVQNDESPILSVVQRVFPEYANDMMAIAEDGRKYWEAGLSQFSVNFTEARIASIIMRGRLVPQVVKAACQEAALSSRDIDVLITNQPNPIFLRNWREALEIPKERYIDTFDRYGNLFGAGIPVTLDSAIREDKLKPNDLLVLGGFSHAGDYAAAAAIRWKRTG